uniref:Calpain-7-like n=1 Tax=Phallusia mammillata TaxID=59560 RepID=A0A6F9D7Q4_9ASCI|nr:calpain-7-like [Phallusia mammillata]
MDVTELENDLYKFASSAVEFDQKGHINEAIFYYKEAVQALMHASRAGSKLDCIEKATEYNKRIEELTKHNSEVSRLQQNQSQSGKDEQRAKFLLGNAFDEDEAGNDDEAIELYFQAAELFINIINNKSNPSISPGTKKKLENMAKQSLDRAETIKTKKILGTLDSLPDVGQDNKSAENNNKPTSQPKPQPSVKKDVNPKGYNFLMKDDNDDSASNHQPTSSASGGGYYTKEEIAVLRFTSLINGKEYLPFMQADLQERFAFRVPFSDKHGLLELSEKQRSRLGGWQRPDEFMSEPQMIMAVSSLSIRQTVVSDCSFVASLAISADYERKFRKKLITSIIYPQNKKREPVYNPCGKYMVKLHLNGVFRKVVIDDRLPVDKQGKLLCSYSANHNELWVSLVEKAYMKVMGGYDFPGSNSNIDLHALTGWIPERQSLRDKDFNPEQFFDKVSDRLRRGHCLATISTGPLSELEADRAGLVPTHAYAVLDMRKVQDLRLLLVKNPWSHLRWKGNFSAQDEKHWTPQLRKELNYDNKFAQEFDNGVFWIDLKSAIEFFDTMYVSWNPDLFKRTTCCHAAWMAKDGPTKDTISLGNNPQYRLEVRSKAATSVWILLTRHITEKEDFAQNKEFITLLVYKNDGKKVYHTYSPPPYIDGVRINSPHYLTRIQCEEGGPHRYTLVVSQYEKHKNIRYTLRLYSPTEFKFSKIEDPYKMTKRIQGAWTKTTAGGCANNKSTHGTNPLYQINIDGMGKEKCQLLIELRAPRDYSIGFDVICVETNAEKPFSQTTSGSFRSGYSTLELTVPHGIYNVIPCTFSPQQLGTYFLDVKSSVATTRVSKLR